MTPRYHIRVILEESIDDGGPADDPYSSKIHDIGTAYESQDLDTARVVFARLVALHDATKDVD
jgi:hypothetical protein